MFGSYRHPRGAGNQVDDGFQGFGLSKSDAPGLYRFRTIRPAPYPGRTPHSHVLLRRPSFGQLISQLFVVGDLPEAAEFIAAQGLAKTAQVGQRSDPLAQKLHGAASHRLVELGAFFDG